MAKHSESISAIGLVYVRYSALHVYHGCGFLRRYIFLPPSEIPGRKKGRPLQIAK